MARSGVQTQSYYSIDATMEPSTTEAQVRLMLRKVLMDRFRLATHRETREFQGYAMVVARNGAKIESAAASGEEHRMPPYLKGKDSASFEGGLFVSKEGLASAITGRGVSLSQLADTLSETLSTFVLDRTGMSGKYYFGFKFLKDVGPADVETPTLFLALQEELGLKLDKQKGPYEALVVDHMEKVPTEN